MLRKKGSVKGEEERGEGRRTDAFAKLFEEGFEVFGRGRTGC